MIIRRLQLLLVCAGTAALATAEPQFDVSVINTESAASQTVLAGYFSNEETADLAIISVTDEGRRNVRFYGVEGGFYSAEPRAELPVPKDVILVDVCRNGKRDSLIFFTRDSVLRFDTEGGSTRLAEVSSMYTRPIRDSVPAMNFCRDLNDDQHDDLIVPGFHGFEVLIYTNDGYEKSVSVEAPPRMEMSYEDDPWYQAHAVYRADMNFDKRRDVGVWIDEHVLV
ncbi:MAG: hypothetical protein HUJ31_17955 [Pseudomonadales bacterium]|nr:hypothetical protein [Pseudomonadales bacterium]